MKRVLIVAIVAVLLIVVGGGLFVLLRSQSDTSDSAKANRTLNTAPSTNTAATPTAVEQVTRVEKGGYEINRTVTYRGVTLDVQTAGEFDAFHGLSLGENQKFVVLFVKPVADASAVSDWMTTDARLVASSGTAQMVRSLELVVPTAGVDTGFVAFTPAKDAQNFRLTFSTDGKTEEAALNLGF